MSFEKYCYWLWDEQEEFIPAWQTRISICLKRSWGSKGMLVMSDAAPLVFSFMRDRNKAEHILEMNVNI